jgi:hypothetical protein
VREIAPPPAARTLSTLARVDYADAFLVSATSDRTAEDWARAVLDRAPAEARAALRRGWFALGLRLGSARSGVLGWELRRNTPDVALLGARSRLGMPAEVLFKREPDGLLFATFVQHRNPLVRAVWAGVAPGHRRVVRRLLEAAGPGG